MAKKKETTLKQLVKEIGIEDDYYQVIKMDRKISFSDLFGNNVLTKGKVTHQLALPPEMDISLMNKFLYLYSPVMQ